MEAEVERYYLSPMCIFIKYRQSEGVFLVADNHVLNEPLGRPLRSFARTALSAHFFAALSSVYRLACSLLSLPPGTVENHENVFMLKTRHTEVIAFVVITGNTPLP